MSDALSGWTVLVPRGGAWGRSVAERLHDHGAEALIAPLIEFAPPKNVRALDERLRQLEAGHYDWLAVTSATTVSALQGVRVPSSTRVAAVGQATAAALAAAGLATDFVPATDYSARAMVDEWPRSQAGLRILLPQSKIAEPLLADGLRALGHHVDTVVAYRTLSVDADAQVVRAVRSGQVRAILVTSGSVAREVARQFSPVPLTTTVACIGTRTAAQATQAGLTVGAVASEQSVESLIRCIIPIS